MQSLARYVTTATQLVECSSKSRAAEASWTSRLEYSMTLSSGKLRDGLDVDSTGRISRGIVCRALPRISCQ